MPSDLLLLGDGRMNTWVEMIAVRLSLVSPVRQRLKQSLLNIRVGVHLVHIRGTFGNAFVPSLRCFMPNTLIDMGGVAMWASIISLEFPANKSGAYTAVAGGVFCDMSPLCRREMMHHLVSTRPVDIRVGCGRRNDVMSNPPHLRCRLLEDCI